MFFEHLIIHAFGLVDVRSRPLRFSDFNVSRLGTRALRICGDTRGVFANSSWTIQLAHAHPYSST